MTDCENRKIIVTSHAQNLRREEVFKWATCGKQTFSSFFRIIRLRTAHFSFRKCILSRFEYFLVESFELVGLNLAQVR